METVKCSVKSGGFAHENLDVINMAIRKQTAFKSLRLVLNQLLRCVLRMNNSRIHGSKRIARTVGTVRKRAAVTAVASHSMLRR